MKKVVGLPLLLILSTVLLLTLAACGQAAEPPTEAPAPTATTAPPTQVMAEPTATPAEQMEEKAMSGDEELAAVAAKLAGGSGGSLRSAT